MMEAAFFQVFFTFADDWEAALSVSFLKLSGSAISGRQLFFRFCSAFLSIAKWWFQDFFRILSGFLKIAER